MGQRIRMTDWSATPLGQPETWAGSLRTLVQVMLTSQQPMFIAWGEQRTMLYNDGYAPMCANRHPWALGKPFAEVWADIIETIGPIMDAAYAGVPTYLDDIEFLMTRNGKLVETHFSFGYTPVHDEGDQIAGMFCTALEITAQVSQGKLSGAELNRLREMLEQAPSFMAVLSGPEHVFEITNAAYMQLIGHRDVIGKSVRQALPDIEGQGFYELLDGVHSTGQPFIARALPAVIQRQPDAAPEQRFMDVIYQPIFGAGKQVSGIFVQGHDITDQKKAEIAAATSEARFRQLAQSILNHVWTAVPDGNLNWFRFMPLAARLLVNSTVTFGPLSSILTTSPPLRRPGPRRCQVQRRIRSSFVCVEQTGTIGGTSRAQLPYSMYTERSLTGSGLTPISRTRNPRNWPCARASCGSSLPLAAAEMGVWECRVANGQFVDLAGDARALVLLGGQVGKSSDFDTFAARIHPDDRAALAPAAMRALDPSGDGVLDIEYRVLPLNDAPEHWVQARAQALRAAVPETRCWRLK